MNNKLYKTEALRFVNKVRKALKRKPVRKLVKGIPSDNEACTLTKSIDDPEVLVTDSHIQFGTNQLKAYFVGLVLGCTDDLNDNHTIIALPRNIATFVRKYDNCEYPELVDIESLLR